MTWLALQLLTSLPNGAERPYSSLVLNTILHPHYTTPLQELEAPMPELSQGMPMIHNPLAATPSGVPCAYAALMQQRLGLDYIVAWEI